MVWDAAVLSAVGSLLQGAGTIAGVVAVVIAARIGSNTFKSWKRQKLAERKSEQAERILTATYKARRGLSHVRNPAMFSFELRTAEDDLKQSGQWEEARLENEQRKLTTAQAYYNRLNQTLDVQRGLEECQPMARALFDKELEKALGELLGLFWTVRVYVGAQHRDSGGDDKLREKIEQTIWEGYPSPDKNEIDQAVAEQVGVIEKRCLPALRLEDEM